MPREIETDIALRMRAEWALLFERVERAYQTDDWPDIRACSGAWFVAGILYENYQMPPLTDYAYDALCRHLLQNFVEATDAGADTLSRDDLAAGTAMGWRDYIKPYHDVAEIVATGKHARGTKAK